MRIRRTSLGFALLASTALILGGCGDDPQTETKEQPIFHTVEECRAAFDSDQCDEMAREAQAEHEKTAPKFDSVQACESQFDSGKCRPTTTIVNGQSQVMYSPILAGFVAGAIGAAVAAHVVNGMAQPNMQRRSTPVYETPMSDAQRKCRNFPSSPECRTGGGGGASANRTSYSYGGTTVATTAAGGRVTTQVTRSSNTGGFWNSRETTPNTNARTPVAPQTAPSPVPRVPMPSASPAPSAPAQVAPRPQWAPPKVTASPTVPSTRGGFGGSAVTRGGFSSGSARGGGGGST